MVTGDDAYGIARDNLHYWYAFTLVLWTSLSQGALAYSRRGRYVLLSISGQIAHRRFHVQVQDGNHILIEFTSFAVIAWGTASCDIDTNGLLKHRIWFNHPRAHIATQRHNDQFHLFAYV